MKIERFDNGDFRFHTEEPIMTLDELITYLIEVSDLGFGETNVITVYPVDLSPELNYDKEKDELEL